MDNDKLNSKDKLISPNIDTTIEEIEISKSHDGRIYRKIDSLEHDGNEGVVNRITTTMPVDACGSIITKREELAGVCHFCGRPIKLGNDARCDGRGAELMCLVCYQRQGSHELYGKKYCRHDYWTTKLFWQFISPSLNRRTENGHKELDGKPGHNAVGDFRQVRVAQQEIRQPDKVYIIKAQ